MKTNKGKDQTVRDLQPSKDAKGGAGGGVRSSSNYGSSNAFGGGSAKGGGKKGGGKGKSRN